MLLEVVRWSQATDSKGSSGAKPGSGSRSGSALLGVAFLTGEFPDAGVSLGKTERLPDGRAAVLRAEALEGVRFGQREEWFPAEAGPARQRGDRPEGGLLAGGRDPLAVAGAEPLHVAEPHPHCRSGVPVRRASRGERAVPVARGHVHRKEAHPPPFGVLDDGRGSVKPHRLRVQQRARELRRVVPQQEGAGIADEGEAGRVAFGKAILAEPLNLLEDPFGELGGDPLGAHAREQAAAVAFHPAGAPPGGHVAAELIGLSRGVVGGDHREPHHLLLKQRDPEGFFEDRPQRRVGILHRLVALAPAEVGMDHPPGDGAGPHDAHLDHQVVVVPGAKPREHGHLRPAFDLKDPDGRGLPDHREGLRVVGREGGQRKVEVPGLPEQPEAEIQLGEGAEPQQVHLEQAQFLDVVLVPLNDRPPFHGGVFHRHDVGDRLLAEQKPAGVDGQMPGESLDFVRQPEKVTHRRAVPGPSRGRQPVARKRFVVGESCGPDDPPRAPKSRTPCPRPGSPSGSGSRRYWPPWRRAPRRSGGRGTE